MSTNQPSADQRHFINSTPREYLRFKATLYFFSELNTKRSLSWCKAEAESRQLLVTVMPMKVKHDTNSFSLLFRHIQGVFYLSIVCIALDAQDLL